MSIKNNYCMCKDEFIAQPEVNKFITYLSDIILRKKVINHKYETARPRKTYSFKYLEDAARGYDWNGCDLSKTNEILDKYSKELKGALDNNKEFETLKYCVEILKWGGVTNGAYGVLKPYIQDKLCETIKQALNEMNRPVVCLDSFKDDKGIYIMNSSFTKIYSLASRDPFVIFDGRVSAALQLVTKNFWIEGGGEDIFPSSLRFPELEGRGANTIKNASDKERNICFKKINNNKSYYHAMWNVRANWILYEALIKSRNLGLEYFASATEIPEQIRNIEAALFMIGYTV